MTCYQIAVANQKGGVGKTTTAVNISGCLAELGYKVLLVDMDPQGHAGEHIGIRSDINILDVIRQKMPIQQAIKKSYKKNLDCLPSNLNLGQFNQLNPQKNQSVFKAAINQVITEYDYIIFDCQPTLSLLTLNAMLAADYILLPVQSEFFALDGLSQLILSLREIQKTYKPNLQILGILLTMFDRRNRLSIEVRQELMKNFGDIIFHQAIPRNVKLAEAPSYGKTITDHDPNSVGADCYKTVTKELIKRVKA